MNESRMPQPIDPNDNTLKMSDLVTAPEPQPEVAPSMENVVADAPVQQTPPGQAIHPDQTHKPAVFRNPLAAGYATHMTDFGAGIPAPSSIPAATQTFLRPNLAPHFDTFIAHGLKPESEPATTFLGKIALFLRLKDILSKKNLRYAGVGLASFAIFLFVFNFQTLSTQLGYWLNPPKPQAPIASTLPAAEVASAVVDQPEVVPAGDIIIIPKLNLASVPIVFEPSISEAAIQKSLEKGVVHYAGTALPGERSNAVIVGHSSNDWWEPGNYKFVFALLEKMSVGDQIQVNYQQKKYVYEVTGSKVVEPTEISVLQPTTEPQLTLITCTPPGTSWKRLVVTAKQIQPLPSTPKTAAATTTPTADKELALPGSAPGFFDQLKKWLGLASETK